MIGPINQTASQGMVELYDATQCIAVVQHPNSLRSGSSLSPLGCKRTACYKLRPESSRSRYCLGTCDVEGLFDS